MLTLTVPAEFIAVLKFFTDDKGAYHYIKGTALEVGATES